MLLDLLAATSNRRESSILYVFPLNFIFFVSSCNFVFQIEARSEPDHVSVPDITLGSISPIEPSVVTAVTATKEELAAVVAIPVPFHL